MGLAAYIPANLATSAGLTGATISSGFPLANLVDGKLGKYTKWHTGGGVVNVHMLVNYDSVFIGNHSLVAGESFEISGNPGLTVTASAASIFRAENLFVDLSALSPAYTANSPYLNINFASSADPIRIGELVVGTRVAFPRMYKWEGEAQQTNLGVTNETRGGVSSDYEWGSYRTFQATWEFPQSEYETFRAFSNAVGRQPFVWIPDVSSSEAYYVKKERGFAPRFLYVARDSGVLQRHYSYTAQLRTESMGLVVTS